MRPCPYCQTPTSNTTACSDCRARKLDARRPTDWPTYARCDECGAEPECCCRDDDDMPMLRPCEGRERKTVAVVVPIGGVRTCPCDRPARDGETCGRRLCRGDLICCLCHAPITSIKGRRPGDRTHCGDVGCRRMRKRMHMEEKRKET